MAAEQGGNCAAHRARQGRREVRRHDHRLHRSAEPHGPPVERSLRDDGLQPAQGGRARRRSVALNLEDEIHRGVLVLKDGELMWPPPKPPPPRAGGPTGAHKVLDRKRAHRDPGPRERPRRAASGCAGGAGAAARRSSSGRPSLLQHLTVFLLACVVGWHVVWNVTPALHTPLMSVTNAISGIILIGGMLALLGGRLGRAGAGRRRRCSSRRSTSPAASWSRSAC